MKNILILFLTLISFTSSFGQEINQDQDNKTPKKLSLGLYAGGYFSDDMRQITVNPYTDSIMTVFSNLEHQEISFKPSIEYIKSKWISYGIFLQLLFGEYEHHRFNSQNDYYKYNSKSKLFGGGLFVRVSILDWRKFNLYIQPSLTYKYTIQQYFNTPFNDITKSNHFGKLSTIGAKYSINEKIQIGAFVDFMSFDIVVKKSSLSDVINTISVLGSKPARNIYIGIQFQL